MKMIKNMMIACLIAGATIWANAQNVPTKSTDVATGNAAKITGKMVANFNSRTTDTEGKPVSGVPDVYTFTNMSVTDTLVFNGTIKALPTMLSSVLGRQTQGGSLEYNLSTSIRNPNNPDQQKVVGKLIGTVPLDKSGAYQYNSGNLRFAIDAAGRAAGFESAFRGIAIGKAPKDSSILASAKKKSMSVSKMVKGKTVSIVVSDYDMLNFQSCVIGAGPMRTYPETTVDGNMLFDYPRSAWYFNGLTMSYTVDGKTYTDKVTGNIKWVEAPNRASTGEGEYQFDVRVNEPTAASGETAVFAAAEDESAFFATDDTIPCLTGTIKYKDTMRGETVAASDTTWDLTGKQLSKIQVTNLFKLIGLEAVIPVNAE